MKKPRAKSSRQSPVASRQSAAQVSEDQHEVEMIVDKMMNELCTVKQSAKILGVQVYQIHQLIEDKRIDAVQLDDWFWVVHKPSLFEYLKTKSRKGRPPSSKPQKPNKIAT
jgi:uncharacterized protein YaiL (DUF2058 family)